MFTNNKLLICLSLCSLVCYQSCRDDGFNVEIPDFDYPQTVTFEPLLSAYDIFEENPIHLQATEDYQLLELSSVLFTDYAQKQRLVKLPEGSQLTKLNDDSIAFPDETILVKTFYFYHDERDTTLGKQLIETRLLVKDNGLWNVATYIWDDEQQDANLSFIQSNKVLSWVNANGTPLSTIYEIPGKNECIACHQNDATIIPLGTTLRNLNREVSRNNYSINQIEHLQALGVMANDFNANQISQIVDFKESNHSTTERARAYLQMNCSHCHNPSGWEAAAEQELDFRYETAIDDTGILELNRNRIINMMSNGRMPYIGTTILDAEGIALIEDFINSL